MEDAKVILTIEEVDALKKIQNNLNQITTVLGQLEIQMSDLKEAKTEVLKKLAEIKAEQNQLGEALSKKYGNGSINIDSGEFTKVS